MAAATGGPLPATVAALTHTLHQEPAHGPAEDRCRLPSWDRSHSHPSASSLWERHGPADRVPYQPNSSPTAPPTPADDPKPSAKPVDAPAAARPKTGTLVVEARDLTTNAPVPDVRLELRHQRQIDIPRDHRWLGHRAFLAFHRETRLTFGCHGHRRWPGFPSDSVGLRLECTGTARLISFFRWKRRRPSAAALSTRTKSPSPARPLSSRFRRLIPNPDSGVFYNDNSAKTDANGRWSFSGAPEKPDSVKLAAYHHLCLPERPFYSMKDFKPLSALRDGSATPSPRAWHAHRGHGPLARRPARGGSRGLLREDFWAGGMYGNAIPPCEDGRRG